MELKHATKKTFDLVVQWMFTGQLILSRAGHTEAEIITQLIVFLQLAQRLGLAGPFDTVAAKMFSVLRSNRDALSPQHIRDVARFPRNHPARTTVAKACVGPFATTHNNPYTFKYVIELVEVDQFASDLLNAFGDALRSMDCDELGAFILDPLTKKSIRITKKRRYDNGE